MKLEYMTSANEEKMFDLLTNLGNTQQCFCSKSYVRLMNAIPDSNGIDIYIDGVMVADNLKFGEFTSYLMVYPDSYNYKIYKTGTNTNPIIDSDVTIKKNTEYTIAATGAMSNPSGLSIYLVGSQKEEIPPVRMAVIKFTNLYNSTKSFNLVLEDGTILYKDIAYKSSTPNLMLVPGTYTINLTTADSRQPIITIPNIELERNNYYQMFAIGDAKDNNGVEVVVPESGLNFLDLC